jgi:hypothetical protein
LWCCYDARPSSFWTSCCSSTSRPSES